jgi:uncharacterized membrane protein YraQ (UPF0718 family)
LKKIKKIIVLFAILIAGSAFAQDLKVNAVLDSSKIRIGEQVKLDVYVTYNANQKNIKIQWPEIGDTITEKIEVINVSPIDTTFPDQSNSSKIFQHQQITISAYDSGYFSIPPFKFIVDGDTANPLYTESFLLEVHTVPTDTSATKLKDIKPLFGEKFNWRWYSAYIYGGIGLLVAIIIAIFVARYYAKKRKEIVIEPEKPKIPAHITALASLEKIREEQVWKEEKIKEYYSSISEVIRQYIEERFNVFALESTTDEIMKAFRSQVVDKESKDKLQQILTLSDLVKFAKMFPIESEHVFSLQNAFDFVNTTKREEVMDLPDSAFTSPGPNDVVKPTTTTTTTPVTGEEQPVKTFTSTIQHPPVNTAIPPVRRFDVKAENLKHRKSNIIKAVVILVLAVSSILAVRAFLPKNGVETLELTASVINKMCPVMVDKDTRLDGAAVIDRKILQYNYTFVNFAKEQLDVNGIKSQFEPSIINQVKTNPELKAIRDNNLDLEYTYKDKNGVFLFTIHVTPQDYNTSI